MSLPDEAMRLLGTVNAEPFGEYPSGTLIRSSMGHSSHSYDPSTYTWVLSCRPGGWDGLKPKGDCPCQAESEPLRPTHPKSDFGDINLATVLVDRCEHYGEREHAGPGGKRLLSWKAEMAELARRVRATA